MLSRISRLSVARARASSALVGERSWSCMSSSHHATVASTPLALDASNRSRMPNQTVQGKFNHQQQCALFSTGTRRRRRRGGGRSPTPMENDSEASSDNSTSSSSASATLSAALTSDQFTSESTKLLDKVESAVAELKDSNDGLEITRYPPSSGSTNYDTDASNTEGDEDDDPKSQPHGGQLSIQVASAGDLYWGGGTYWLTINTPSSEGSGGFVTLRSPLSGTYNYVYNATSGEWVGSEDGHSLLGMMTRDWIRQCRGVPNF